MSDVHLRPGHAVAADPLLWPAGADAPAPGPAGRRWIPETWPAPSTPARTEDEALIALTLALA